MAEILPFCGILYNVAETELADVLSPPYDVISPSQQDALYARDPRNIVRIVLNRSVGEAAYRDAGETFATWMREGLLAPDPEPALYVLRQQFSLEGRQHFRQGLLARFRVEDPESRVILPHERTREAPKEDRYRLLKSTRANFSPIFLMVADPEGAFSRQLTACESRPPALSYTDDDGVGHTLFRVLDERAVSTLQALLAPKTATIADGHHRYATALRTRDELGTKGAWTLGYFTPVEAPGLLVLPYHRVLKEGPSVEDVGRALEGMFLISPTEGASATAREAAHSTMPYAFGFAGPGGRALVAEALPEAEDLLPQGGDPSLRVLDTYFLHRALLGRVLQVSEDAVEYAHSLPEVEGSLTEGRCHLAILMRPTPVRQIVAVAEARQAMPPKSTFFYPKLPSGLVIHPLEAG